MASASQAPGTRNTVILSAGLNPSSVTPLITPRATRSARVLDTTLEITAIFSTPGFESTSLVNATVFFTLGLPPSAA